MAAQLGVVVAFALPQAGEAASCTVGAGLNMIGTEFFATAAYPDGSFLYEVTILQCTGGVPSYFNGTAFNGTPVAVTNAYRTSNASRVFRNRCGSMGLIAHDRFLGTIDDGVATVNLALSAHPLNATYYDEFVKGIAPGEGFPISCGCTGGLAKLFGSAFCAPPPAVKAPDVCVANPVLPGQGCKVQWETDYSFGESSLLSFKRYYSSQSPYHHLSGARRTLGSRWRHHHDVFLNPAAGSNLVLLLRGDGQILHFRPKPGSTTEWISDADIVGQLLKTPTGWTWRDADDALETYDSAGRRLSRVERSGWSLSYTYVPGSDRLAEIQDHYGRRLILTYNGQNLLSEITTPAGHKVTYAYDGDGQLITVTYPDTHRRRYTYTSVTVDGHPEPALLTSITDENATLYASWNYDSRARPATSEHAGGVERHTFAYQPTTAGAITGATVTNPLAAVTQYTFQNILGANRLDSVSQPLAPGATRRYTYDANGNPASVTDYHGTLTSYTYDPVRNLELRRVEAEGRPEARTISTEWHASYRLPLRIAEPLKLTTFAYDAAGNPLTRSEQATPDVNGSQGFGAPPIGAARVWTLTYHGVGQVETINGPRTDVADVTTTTYYPASDPDLGKRGQLASVTNALGHLTTITAYDADGRPLTLVDANGNPHQFTWDVRGRLTRRALAGEQTTYTYDPAGQLTRIDAPDGSILRYTYDPAHRLTRIEDALGNRIDYTLDAAGNRLKEEVRDNGGALTRARTRQYDALSRLTQELGGQTPPQLLASYRYDAQGNRLEASTPLGTGSRSWGHSYDALSRLVRVTDPHGGITQTTYDGQHQVIAITDPRHLVTTYTRDGLGRTTRIASPDSGLTQQTFDAAGNLLTRTDAKDQPTTTTYDALDRPLRIDHADTAYDLYHWDQGDQGKGRLTRIEQYAPGGALTLAIDRQYDAHGRLLQESRQLAGVTYRSQYRYTHGRLSGLTTANGRRIDYTHDAQGRIDSITLTVGSDVRVLARDIRYHPFGGVKELTHGAGQTLRWTQDSDGRPSGYRLGDRHWQLGYDNAWRITSQMDTLDATQSVTTAYDALDRLTQASLGTVSHGYTYDATGNRLSQTTGASPRHYTIAASSNRLTAISGSPAKTYPHDANGSLSSDGAGQTHTYDARGRLRRVTVAGVSTDYLLDPFGQRIRKTGADDTLYHYDADGRLQSESAPDGTPRKDYVWLGDQPLAIIH